MGKRDRVFVSHLTGLVANELEGHLLLRCSSPPPVAVRVNNLQPYRRRHATCYQVDTDDEEHGGNQLAAVLFQETDDGIEDAVEMLR